MPDFFYYFSLSFSLFLPLFLSPFLNSSFFIYGNINILMTSFYQLDKKLVEFSIDEKEVLSNLNNVSLAKRVANLVGQFLCSSLSLIHFFSFVSFFLNTFFGLFLFIFKFRLWWILILEKKGELMKRNEKL